MTTTNFPKSVEAPIIRFFHSPISWDKGVKNGGMTAVVKLPADQNEGGWNDVLVYQPDMDGDKWWDLVPRNTVIRVSIREVAKNKQDLIGFALPLQNQPSNLQALIKHTIAEKLEVEEEKKEEAQPEPSEGDKLEAQLWHEVVKKQHLEVSKAHSKRLQRLILMGEWLEKNESALKCIQSTITSTVFDWYDDNSEEADTTALHKMLDALHFHMDLIRDLRQNCWCPDTDCDGTLYYKGHDGKPVKVIDLNEVP
jgi:hypothetical protein